LKAVSGLGGVYLVSGVSGCVDYLGGGDSGKNPTPPKTTVAPTVKRFTSELKIEGEETFVKNVENMLRVLKEYSPEWYEKTMYAGERIIRDDYVVAGMGGKIRITVGTAELGGSNDIKQVLAVNANFPHEVQHVIDMNTYFFTNRDDITLVKREDLGMKVV